MPVRRVGDAAPVRRRSARSTSPSDGRRRFRRLAHGPGPTLRPAGAGAAPAPAAPMTSARCRRAAPSTASCATSTGACSTICSPTALGDVSFLTITNAANHERDLAWMQRHGEEYDADVLDRRPTSRCSRYRVRLLGELVRSAQRRAPARALPLLSAQRRRGAGAGLRHRLHRRGRRRAADRPGAGRASRSGRRCSARARLPAGLGARDTLRLEACFHLYGNDLSRGPRPDRRGARLVLRRGDGIHRRGRRVRCRGPASPGSGWCRS